LLESLCERKNSHPTSQQEGNYAMHTGQRTQDGGAAPFLPADELFAPYRRRAGRTGPWNQFERDARDAHNARQRSEYERAVAALAECQPARATAEDRLAKLERNLPEMLLVAADAALASGSRPTEVERATAEDGHPVVRFVVGQTSIIHSPGESNMSVGFGNLRLGVYSGGLGRRERDALTAWFGNETADIQQLIKELMETHKGTLIAAVCTNEDCRRCREIERKLRTGNLIEQLRAALDSPPCPHLQAQSHLIGGLVAEKPNWVR
jgi:hypothetical protein